jgi:hypothetical protein
MTVDLEARLQSAAKALDTAAHEYASDDSYVSKHSTVTSLSSRRSDGAGRSFASDDRSDRDEEAVIDCSEDNNDATTHNGADHRLRRGVFGSDRRVAFMEPVAAAFVWCPALARKTV